MKYEGSLLLHTRTVVYWTKLISMTYSTMVTLYLPLCAFYEVTEYKTPLSTCSE